MITLKNKRIFSHLSKKEFNKIKLDESLLMLEQNLWNGTKLHRLNKEDELYHLIKSSSKQLKKVL